MAVIWSDEAVVRRLLEAGADPNLRIAQAKTSTSFFQSSALEAAEQNNRWNMKSLLLKYGAKLCFCRKCGKHLQEGENAYAHKC